MRRSSSSIQRSSFDRASNCIENLIMSTRRGTGAGTGMDIGSIRGIGNISSIADQSYMTDTKSTSVSDGTYIPVPTTSVSDGTCIPDPTTTVSSLVKSLLLDAIKNNNLPLLSIYTKIYFKLASNNNSVIDQSTLATQLQIFHDEIFPSDVDLVYNGALAERVFELTIASLHASNFIDTIFQENSNSNNSSNNNDNAIYKIILGYL